MPEPTPDAARPPIVQAVRVLDEQRPARRRALFALFFTHQPGDRRDKMRAAYRLIDTATEPGEHARLRDLLRLLQSVADSCAPADRETP